MFIDSVIWFFAWIVVAQCCVNRCVRAQGWLQCDEPRRSVEGAIVEMWDDDGMYKKGFFSLNFV
jgi:hypothetical protein